MDRKKLIEEVIHRVRDGVPPSEVIEKYVSLKRTGNGQSGICPFHGAKTIGSFSVSDQKKMWKCFNCGEAGDVIKFYSSINNMRYSESAIKLATEYGLLSLEEDEFLNRDFRYVKKNIAPKKVQPKIKTKEVKENERASDEIIDKVYRIFININKFLKKDILSEAHKKALINDRHLTEDEIKRDLYFSFPTRHVIKYIISELKSNNIDTHVLKSVPGFFYDKKKESYSFMTVKGGGIGIPILNRNGLITTIQIRKDTVGEKNGKKENRYTFFSSSFAVNYNDFIGGVGCGSPVYIDKNYTGVPCRSIFITEGIFKSKIITKEFNSISLSVQGVSSWRCTIPEVEVLKKDKNYLFDKVIIAYDGDLCYNLGVFEQALKMGLHYGGYSEKQIYSLLNNPEFRVYGNLNKKEDPTVFFALWDVDYGKGIDDMILNGHKGDLKKLDLESLYNMYVKFKNKIYNLIGVLFEDLSSVPDDVLNHYFKEEILTKI